MTEYRRVKDTEVSGLGGSFRGGGCPWLSGPNERGGVKAWKMVGKQAVSRVARVSVVEAEEKEAKVWGPGDPGKGPIINPSTPPTHIDLHTYTHAYT